MSDEIMGTEAETETAAVETQEGKTFTQEELDRIVADRVSREQRKFDKRISGVDIDEARELLAERARRV
jgi:phosphopantothenoylcysteine synthetase/decarboxylase